MVARLPKSYRHGTFFCITIVLAVATVSCSANPTVQEEAEEGLSDSTKLIIEPPIQWPVSYSANHKATEYFSTKLWADVKFERDRLGVETANRDRLIGAVACVSMVATLSALALRIQWAPSAQNFQALQIEDDQDLT
eukprot:TRINITY_DN3063_c0_g2_i1.p1 TRINITY_DN3063_c0_g2~~TRINITY_DN3063_c0_g2_i1.p1  ORF type:complete len:137 (+),score=12.18 TRINITY_DN3063_c0_g2_i1:93-503(+)